MDLRFRDDRVMCVAGPSQSGKTHFVLKLLDQRQEHFVNPLGSVLWCYGIYDSALHRQLENKGYKLHRGLPNEADIVPNSICVMDDLLTESQSSKEVTNMCTRLAHHKPCLVILIVQNLFPSGKDARTRSLNTHYYIIFKNPRDNLQFEVFARQIKAQKAKSLISAYEDATHKPYGYLLIDFTQECPDPLRYRTNVLDLPVIIYKIF